MYSVLPEMDWPQLNQSGRFYISAFQTCADFPFEYLMEYYKEIRCARFSKFNHARSISGGGAGKAPASAERRLFGSSIDTSRRENTTCHVVISRATS